MSPSSLAPTSLNAWFKTPAGQYILEWENIYFKKITEDVFGFNAIQMGLPEIDALSQNRVTFRHLACLKEESNYPNPMIDIISSLSTIPLPTESADLIVLPHTLERVDDINAVLDEIDRVLRPEGTLAISGFNPYSLFGITKSLKSLPQFTMISLENLRDQLKKRSYETEYGFFGCYCPALSDKSSFERFAFLEKAGNRWWPHKGGIYLFSAIKRVVGVTIINPTFQTIKTTAANTVTIR